MTTKSDLLAGTARPDLDRTLICDIEVYHGYFLAAFKRLSDGKVVAIEMSTRTAREDDDHKRAQVRSFLKNYRIVTYNGMGYDMPLLWYFVCGASNEELKRASNMIIEGGAKYWEIEKLLDIRVPKSIDHIDLIEPQPNPFVSLKALNGRLHGRWMQDLPVDPNEWLTEEQMDFLTTYCGNDLNATELLFYAIDDPIKMREAFGREYDFDFRSKSDSQMGEQMIKMRVEKMRGERVQKINTPGGTVFKFRVPDFIKFEGNAELQDMVDRLRETEFMVQAKGKVDLPAWLDGKTVTIGESTYAMGIGGLHSTETTRAVFADEDYALIDVDVASYYPAIILNSGLYPKALGPEFLQVYRAIRQERIDAKARAKWIKDVEIPAIRDMPAGSDNEKRAVKARYKALDEEYDACITKDKGLKIALNGCFGKLGSVWSVLYAPHLMIAVTLTGQLSLLMLINRLEQAGISVVSANTDGIVVRPHRDDAALPIVKDRLTGEGDFRAIVDQWEKDTGFDLEATEYEALYNQSVNSYIAIKPGGKAKIKGPLATPRLDGDMRGQLMKNPQMDVLTSAVVAHIVDGTPLEETIRGCTDLRSFVTVVQVTGGSTWRGKYLGKTVRYYWSTDGEEILKKVPHASTGVHGKVSKTDGCKPIMEYPEDMALPGDIDYGRYVAEAREILMNIGFVRRPPKVQPIKVYKYNAALWFALAA